MEETKKHPAYKEAIEQIVKRFNMEGYGTIITDAELDAFMSVTEPSGNMTYGQYKAIEMERLQRYKAIEVLLEDHNICMIRSRAVPGFEILPPKDQIKTAYDRRMAKVRRELNRAASALSNVNHALLTMEEENDRQQKMVRAAFIKGAINKRKIEIVRPPEKKQITEKNSQTGC
jgi:hypothetical protein